MRRGPSRQRVILADQKRGGGEGARQIITIPDWLASLGAAPPAQFYALVFILCGLPALAALFSRRQSGSGGPAQRYASALAGLIVVWSLLPIASLLTAMAGSTAAHVLPLLERFALAMSAAWIGWAYLTADRRQRRRAYLYTVSIGLLLLLLVSLWFCGERNSPTSSFQGSVCDVLWQLVLGGLGALGLIACFVQARELRVAAGKLLFFALLMASALIALLPWWSGALPAGDSLPAARWAGLAALMTFPVVVARSLYRQEARDEQRLALAAEIGPTTGEWVALQALRQALAGAAEDERLPQALLRAASRVSGADIALLLRPPRRTSSDNEQVADGNLAYAEVLALHDEYGARAVSLSAISLSGLPQIAAALAQSREEMLVASELAPLKRQLDADELGAALLLPVPRAGAALLLIRDKANAAFAQNEREFAVRSAALLDELLNLHLAGESEERTPSSPAAALARAREHILRLTAHIADMRQRPPSPPELTIGEDAPLPLKALLEEKQRQFARLQVEKATLSERLAEWETILRALGIEESAYGLWRFLEAEKQRAALLRAEIEHLRAERAGWHGDGEERWREITGAEKAATPAPVAARPDLLSLIERSIHAAAAAMRQKDLRLELVLPPNLPALAGSDAPLLTALSSLLQQLASVLPPGSQLRIAVAPARNRLELEISGAGALTVPPAVMGRADASLAAIGGELRQESGGSDAGPERLILRLPIENAAAPGSAITSVERDDGRRAM